MKIESSVLCGASAGAEKYYFNPAFSLIPETVREELRTMCVLFAAEFGGTVLIVFDEEGNVKLQTVRDEDDMDYDEIGAEVKIRRLLKEKRELFSQLEQFYAHFFLTEDET